MKYFAMKMPAAFPPVRWLLACIGILMLAALAAGAAQAAAFSNDQVAREAESFESYLRQSWSTEGATAPGFRARGDAARKAGNPRAATGAYASAVVLERDNAESWLALARAYLAISPSNYTERNNFSRNATSAAWIAYQRANGKALKAAALAELAKGLEARSMWRPAIDAYAASLDVQEGQRVRMAYERLRAEHGFRMLDYTVESDAAAPRVCIQFSERLAKGVDFANYVSVDGADPDGIRADDQQICVEELRHGRRYAVRLRQGLPSAIGESLLKPVDLSIYVRDRSPSARFTGRNYVLPRTGQKGLPVVTVNTEELKIALYRIGDRRLAHEVLEGRFGEPIAGYRAEEIKTKHGELLWEGQMPVDMKLNEEITTAFPIDELHDDLKPGLYVMTAQPASEQATEWSDRATQWFVISDIGLMAYSGTDGIHAFARGLSSAEPIEGLELRLLARNNDVLATTRTDGSGYVRFEAGLTRGEGGLAPALVVARTPEGDYGFLDLTRQAFDLTDRGVGGRPAPGPLDAMVFAERGVYRPGEPVFLTALLRDDKASAVSAPLTLIIRRPDGKEHARVTPDDQGAGGRAHMLALRDDAMAGTWRVSAHVDPEGEALGETAFLVEDYVPERMELTLTPSSQPATPEAPARVALEGRYLYGAPASGLRIDGDIRVVPGRSLSEHPGFVFGLEDDEATPVRAALDDLPQTDGEGRAEIEAPLPALPETTRPLKAEVTLRLSEPGGRAISETASMPVAADKTLLGIKPLFDGGRVAESSEAGFEIIATDGAEERVDSGPLEWELLRVRQRYQWYSRYGRWDYEPVTYTERVASGTAEASADGVPSRIAAPVERGRYRLVVTRADSGANALPVASYTFSAGWYVAEAADTPDILDIALDRKSYRPGDTMQVRLEAGMAGKAIVSIVSDELLETRTLDVPEDGATVSFEVRADWGPGAYVTASVFRPMNADAGRMPSRAVGISWVPLDQSARRLKVSLDAPDTMRPRQTLSVPVRLAGLAAGEAAYVTLAAVDVGILNLTGYKAPKPDMHYLGQRRLGMEIRDLYGRLIDGMQGTRGRIRTGGDAPGGMSMEGRPRNIEPVALYSGIVQIGPEGRAEVSFDIPAFDGTLRLMASAWSATQVGHAVKDVVVRDPVTLLGTAPLFLTVGDESRLHLSVHNVDGPSGEYTLSAEADSGLELGGEGTQTLSLDSGARMSVSLPLKAAALGSAGVRVTLESPDGLSVARDYALDIKPAAPNVSRRSLQMLAAKSGTLSVTSDLAADLIPETVRVAVNVGRTAAMDVPGLLLALDRFPYGCAEQTVSRALPLLYLNELAESAGVAGEEGAQARIAASISRLSALQGSSGDFGLWSAGSYNTWLTAYVTDFLLRAREKGYEVREQVVGPALDRLRNAVSYASDFSNGGDDLAYALYVLARAGRAIIGDLRYYADAKLEDFATPLAQAQIGAALALYGDMPRARKAFDAARARLAPSTGNQTPHRSDFGSRLRDSAGLLTLVAETRAMDAELSTLLKTVEAWRAQKQGTTTQENAWLLLAAHALSESGGPEIALEVNGERRPGPVQRVLSGRQLADTPFVVRNLSETETPVSLLVTGASVTPEPATQSGLSIARQAHTLAGEPISLDEARQNERYVIVLTVREQAPLPGQLVIEDRLPAGFQIENPRLVPESGPGALPWLKTAGNPAHTAFRDDSFMAAFSLTDANRSSPATLSMAYVVRAVVPGSYVRGGAKVEDMYRPERFARSAPGRVKIGE